MFDSRNDDLANSFNLGNDMGTIWSREDGETICEIYHMAFTLSEKIRLLDRVHKEYERQERERQRRGAGRPLGKFAQR